MNESRSEYGDVGLECFTMLGADRGHAGPHGRTDARVPRAGSVGGRVEAAMDHRARLVDATHTVELRRAIDAEQQERLFAIASA